MRKKSKILVWILISLMTLQILSPVSGILSEAVSKPKLNVSKLTLLEGASKTLKLKKAAKNIKLTWKSRNQKIATVSKKGRVKAIKKGTTNIECTYRRNKSKKTLTCKVTVIKGAKSVSILNQSKVSVDKLSFTEGSKSRLYINLTPKGSNDVVSFQSNRPKVVTVSKNGSIQCVKSGTAIVTAKTLSGKKDTVEITVTPLSGTDTTTPVQEPTATPRNEQTPTPTVSPTTYPSKAPTATPVTEVTAAPSSGPTATPIATPTAAPSASPTVTPTATPTAVPTASPTVTPTATPTAVPTASPTVTPSATPTAVPTASPTVTPTATPASTPIAASTVLQVDFENGIHPFIGRDSSEVLTVQNGGYNDTKSLLVSRRTKNWHGAQVDVLGMLEDYQAYTVEAYVKQSTGSTKTINCKFDYTDSDGARYYLKIDKVSASHNTWTKINAVVNAPGNASKLSVFFEMENYTNDFTIDNVTIKRKDMDRSAVLAVDSLQEAFSGKFDMGTAVSTYQLKNRDIADFVKHHYNTITFSDEMKPDVILLEAPTIEAADGMPVINEKKLDECMTLAEENGLRVRVHTLIWHSQTPTWFFCENYKVEYDGSGKTNLANITNLVDKETMLKRIRSYVTKVVTYLETNYPGTAYAYDVVNEVVEGSKLRTINENSLYGAIFNAGTVVADLTGETTYITEAFQAAKLAANACGSSVKMYYNDYNGYSPGTRKAIVAALADAKAGGYVDGIGMQSHLTNLLGSDSDNIKNSLNHFTTHGYEVDITELDIHNTNNTSEGNDVLAARYNMLFKQLLGLMQTNHLKLTNVTFWGLTDQDTWLTEKHGVTSYPLLFDGDYLPKPAYYAVMETAPNAPASTAAPTVVPTAIPTVSPTVAPTTNPTTSPTSTPSVTPPPSEGSVTLAIADGSIVIGESGYSVNGGVPVPFTGDYIITGNGTATNQSITINGGMHKIEIRNLVISSPAGASPIQIIGGAQVWLTVTGVNTLTAANNYAGIEVIKGTTLTIDGTGTLNATGGSNSAGVGARGNDQNVTGTLGTIIINGGTIIANGGGNGAGIGDSRGGKGGTVIINGGNVFAKSSRQAAGVGAGGSDCNNAGEYEGMLVIINGGLVSGGGSAADIGWGATKNTNTRLEVYGGSLFYHNGKGKAAGVEPTKDTYIGVSVGVGALTSIDAVYIDGVDQRISGFHMQEGIQKSTIPLQLFMTKDADHTVTIISGGSTYTASVTNNTATGLQKVN